jgi:hypothetical protein
MGRFLLKGSGAHFVTGIALLKITSAFCKSVFSAALMFCWCALSLCAVIGCLTTGAEVPNKIEGEPVREAVFRQEPEPVYFAAQDGEQMAVLKTLSPAERQDWVARRREDWLRSPELRTAVSSDAALLALDHELNDSADALNKLAVRYLNIPLPSEVGSLLSAKAIVSLSQMQGTPAKFDSVSIHLHPLWWFPRECSVFVNGIVQAEERLELMPQQLMPDDRLLVVQWCPPGAVRALAQGRVPLGERRVFIAHPSGQPIASHPSLNVGLLGGDQGSLMGGSGSAEAPDPLSSGTESSVGPRPEFGVAFGRFSIYRRQQTKSVLYRGGLLGLESAWPLGDFFYVSAGLLGLDSGQNESLRQSSSSRSGSGSVSALVRSSVQGQWSHSFGSTHCGLRAGAGPMMIYQKGSRLLDPAYLSGRGDARFFCGVTASARSIPVVGLAAGVQFWRIIPPFAGWGAEILVALYLSL